MSILKTIAALGLISTVSVGTAFAQDISIYSNKTPWNAGMTGIAEAARTASGQSINLQEITPTDRYQAFMQTSIAGNNVLAFFTWRKGQHLNNCCH